MEVAMNRSEGISYPFVDGAWAKLRDAIVAAFEARNRALAIRELQRLSDRTLRDIGLERADIAHAVHKGRLPWS
jgi:uncharacterized protein YjiS (DUF1127 family)